MTDRILTFLKYKNIQSSKFADEIGVQRSSISHLLSGRNKPSLEFIQKILIKYPEVNPNWLLLGQGEMLLSTNTPSLFSQLSIDNIPTLNQEKQTDLHDEKQVEIPIDTSSNNLLNNFINFENKEVTKNIESKNTELLNQKPKEEKQYITNVNNDNLQKETEVKDKKLESEKKLEKIIFFYSDKSFETYYPS